MVIFIIGLSGSGKTYFAKKIYNILNKKIKKLIHLDGDEIRKYITYDLNYSINDRKKNHNKISNLCLMLEKKGFVVICSCISIFPNLQKRNKRIFKKYYQIFLDINIEKLKKRNNKKIYQKKNVVGIDIKFPKPYKSDLILKNNENKNRYIYNKVASKIIKLYANKKN